MTDQDNKKEHFKMPVEEQKKVAKFLCEESGFSKEVGMEVLEVADGYCSGRIRLEKRHMNPLNTVHGGVFFALADTICGIAAASTGYGGPTVQGDMDYMRPVKGKEITCTARVAKTGRTLTWVEGIITDDNGIEVARTKFIYYRLKETRHFGFESMD
jgi:acyl-CoA thioesterase